MTTNTMAFLKNKLTLLLLCALVVACASQAAQGGPHESQGGPHDSQGGSHESQGSPHESQGRVRRQVQNEGTQGPNWTACDFTGTTTLSCADCNTRLKCKPIGGILIPCRSPNAPYCNNGICSPVPAEGC